MKIWELNIIFYVVFSFSSLRFVRLEDLFSANLPLLPSEFEEFVQRQCQTTRNELVQK